MKIKDNVILDNEKFRKQIKHLLDSKVFIYHINKRFSRMSFLNFRKGKNLTQKNLSKLKEIYDEF